MTRVGIAVLAGHFLVGAACAGAQEGQGKVPVIGGPCEGCEAVFVGMPDEVPAEARIAPPDEPGEPMVITGTAYDADGRPVPGVIIYAYQTDAGGEYPPAEQYDGWARRHGELRGWARTDAEGRYRFETIRPASYPDQTTPAHVHMHVIEPGCCTYWISAIHFADDPLLNDAVRRRDGRGGPGIVEPRREDGAWVVERDIRLGQGVPGYR